jgi:hypothetical protein
MEAGNIGTSGGPPADGTQLITGIIFFSLFPSIQFYPVSSLFLYMLDRLFEY